MHSVIFLVQVMCQTVILCFGWEQVLSSKLKKRWIVLLYFGLMTANYIEYSLFKNVAVDNIIRFLITIITFLLCYKDSAKKRIIVFFATELLGLASALSAEFISTIIFNVKRSSFANIDAVHTAGMIISTDILFMFTVIVAMIIKRKKAELKDRSLLVMLIFMVVHLLFIIFYYLNNSRISDEKNNLVQIVFQMLIVVMVIIQYNHSLKMAELMKNEEKMRKMELEIKHTYDYYEAVNKKYLEISKIRHDFQNQLDTISAMQQNGDNSEINEYIGDIQKRLSSSKLVRYCDNSVVNSIMTLKLDELNGYEIDTDIILKDCDRLVIDKYDMCSLFANLMDNAIEAVMKVSDKSKRYLQVRSAVSDSYFVIRMINSVCGQLKMDGEKYISDKKTPNHGLGTDIIQSIAEKYNGVFSLVQENDIVKSVILIPIKN